MARAIRAYPSYTPGNTDDLVLTECLPSPPVHLLISAFSPGPVTDPKVLIEGVLFRARYLGSTQLVCEGQPTKATRMMQAEEAVSRIKVNITDKVQGGARHGLTRS